MNRPSGVYRCRSSKRPGVLAICVLVCLTVAATIMSITVHGALRARRHSRLEHQMVQTEWLLDAGVRRARASLQNQADYEGETWTPVGALERFGATTVEIVVSGDLPGSPTVTVTATIVESTVRARTTRRSHQFKFQPNSLETSTAE